ncbi:helix-turn-helix domain-containing protein [Enterococcus pingfangensis]
MKIAVTKQFQDFVKGIGLSLNDILQKADIPNILWKEELQLSPTDYNKFLLELDHEITDDQLLAFSQVENYKAFMPPFFVALCAKDALICFKRFAIYKKLICPLIIEIEENETTISLRLSFDIPDSQMARFTLLSEQMALISLIRTGTGEAIKPVEVKAPYPYSSKLIDFVGIQPKIAESNVITFQKTDVLRPFVTQNNVMWEYLEPELKKRVAQLNIENSFINHVEKALFSAIPSAHFSRETIAKSLGVSVRTMQRKLNEQNTTYAQLVQKVQQLLAINYLKNNELATEEISCLVGYKDQASFSRAFKSWTGQTITEYKAAIN